MASKDSTQVFIRIKRKRTDEPLDTIFIQNEPLNKKQVSSQMKDSISKSTNIIKAFQQLSTNDTKLNNQNEEKKQEFTNKYIFERIDTIETVDIESKNHRKWTNRLQTKAKALRERKNVSSTSSLTIEKQQLNRKQRQLEQSKARKGLQLQLTQAKTHTLSNNIRLVDIIPSIEKKEQEKQLTKVITSTNRVLNPMQRELDESIWIAFHHNEFTKYFNAVKIQTDQSIALQFQRPIDGSTILMAAARHGRVDVIECLLRAMETNKLSGLDTYSPVLLRDLEDRRASDFAKLHGHDAVAEALLACEAIEESKEYVYDVYCIDVEKSKGVDQGDEEDHMHTAMISVSSKVQRWLAGEQGEGVNRDSDSGDELVLESLQRDENLSEEEESIDSNDEDYILNDYPDESESDIESEHSESNHGDWNNDFGDY